MRIKHLKLLNFRNHQRLEIDFEKTNLILGPNGSGKTSILEAIFLLSTSKSPRSAKNEELIRFFKKTSFLELILTDAKERIKTIRLEISRQKENGSKTFSIDGVVAEPKNIVGLFKAVYFSPETLEIINGSPQVRRRFIDILLSQIDHSYLADLIEYKKILSNRNHLLKEINRKKRGRDEILFWDMKLIEFGAKIMRRREEALESLSKPLALYHQQIADKNGEKLNINYHPSFSWGKDQEIEEAFAERLSGEIDFELRYGSTFLGPHRDDVRFYLSGREAASFCSRGEIRSIVIALVLAEADYIKKTTDDLPVVLLDDIFSELDEERARALGDLILEKYQTIITSTNKESLQNIIHKKINLIKLKNKVYV